MTFLSHLINGISLGSVYAIIALGYTMVYGIAKMLNFAHGDVIMVGAYISFCTTSYLGLPPPRFRPDLHRCVYGSRNRSGKTRIQTAPSGSFPRSAHHRHRRFLFFTKCSPAHMGFQPQDFFLRRGKLVCTAF